MTWTTCRECRGTETVGYEDREVTCPMCGGEGAVLEDHESEDIDAPPPTDDDAPLEVRVEREAMEDAMRRVAAWDAEAAKAEGERQRATAWRDVA